MKKIIFGGMLTLCFAVSVFAGDISVSVNGSLVEFASNQPFIESGRTLIPLRGVFEKMGYSVDWYGDTKTAVLESDSHKISITADELYLNTDGTDIEMDVAAKIVDGSMYIPLRAVGEASGAEVSWDSNTKTALIYTSSNSAAVQESGDTSVVDYLAARSAIIAGIGNYDFSSATYSLSSDNFYDDISNVYQDVVQMQQTLSSAVSSINALTVPDGYEQLHSLTIKSLEKQQELSALIISLAQGSISMEQAQQKLDVLASEAAQINSSVNNAVSSLSF